MLYLSAILIAVGVALFVAAPLFESSEIFSRRKYDPELEKLEHERALAVAGLRELEFDRQMNKLSDTDFNDLRRSLENRAIAAMASIEKLAAAAKPSSTRSASPKRSEPMKPSDAKPEPRQIRYCPECGKPVAPRNNFCAECGSSLRALERA